jgi:hypothetical protein
VQANTSRRIKVDVAEAEVGDLLGACAAVVEEEQERPIALARLPRFGRRAKSRATSSRSRKRTSLGGERFVGIAATRWQTVSISGVRVAT